MANLDAPPKIREEIAAWFLTLARCMGAVDFKAASQIYDSEIFSFGSVATVPIMDGWETLEREQFRRVWPTTEDTAFETDTMRLVLSDDQSLAVAAIRWSSKGLAEDGTRFDRPGRATVVFRRAGADGPWRALHTNIALDPGVPLKSHGNKPEGRVG